jgi:HD-GYP domain-containing protein (c-di-GMP phosphodiesterase class II)
MPGLAPARGWHLDALAQYAGAMVFPLVGALWGRARDTDALLRAQLSAANERLKQSLAQVVQALRSALAVKDTYTGGHAHRVSSYALEVGGELGMAARELEILEVASALHDVGKLAVPESILGKPGPLAAPERELIARHPEVGARILEDLEDLRDAAPLVLHHQERWDGGREPPYPGYPAGLAGDAIPLGARIIAVVDAFDAMTTDRPYRARLSPERALAVLLEESGRQFDPGVVAAFAAALHRRPWTA